ncbi:MAG: hypothetical protein ABI551_25455, partial [Polyangiaceae bacterium]
MSRQVMVLVLASMFGAAALTGCTKHGVHAGTSSSTTATPSPGANNEGATAPTIPKTAKVACTVDPRFPSPVKLPEASAAAEVELTPGEREILVVS